VSAAPAFEHLPVLSRNIVVMVEPRSVGLEVAAEMYGLSADTIARLQDAGRFPVLRVGLVPIAQADAWVAAEVARQAGQPVMPSASGVAV
jgi:hypothetical protein